MSTNAAPLMDVHLGGISDSRSWDEPLDKVLADEDLSVDLIDLINQNFLLEVEASHVHSETTGGDGSYADSI